MRSRLICAVLGIEELGVNLTNYLLGGKEAMAACIHSKKRWFLNDPLSHPDRQTWCGLPCVCDDVKSAYWSNAFKVFGEFVFLAGHILRGTLDTVDDDLESYRRGKRSVEMSSYHFWAR